MTNTKKKKPSYIVTEKTTTRDVDAESKTTEWFFIVEKFFH